MGDKSIRVLIADDHVMYREGLHGLMDSWDGFEVIGEASNGQEAVEFCRRTVPDLVLMDIDMPVMDGVEAAAALRALNPGIPVVMLTVSADEENLFGALYNGVQGYILKDTPARQLRNRLRAVANGEATLSDAVASRVFKEFNAHQHDAYVKKTHDAKSMQRLTSRETDILRLVAQGLSNEEIGTQLFLGSGTVKKQLSIIMQKLGLTNRVQVAVYAIRTGLAS